MSPLASGRGFVCSTVSRIMTPVRELVSDAWLLLRGHLELVSSNTAANDMTDLTENKDTRIALENIISILSRSPYDPLPPSPLASSLMGAFHHAVQAATIENPNSTHPVDSNRGPWKEVFWSEVATVARALLAEQDLEDQEFTMQEWLDLRVLTISGKLPLFDPFRRPCLPYSIVFSPQRLCIVYIFPFPRPILGIHDMLIHIYPPTARPLLVLLQASFGLPASSGDLIVGPLKNLPLILGLQNDILGFDKDHLSGNQLSALQVLIRDGMDKKRALLRIVGLHNRLVTEMMAQVERFEGTDAERDYVSAASRWPNAMAQWMVSCERYKVTV